MKSNNLYWFCSVLFQSTTLFGQYSGGSGNGNSALLVSGISLSVNTPFSGGNDDGTVVLTQNTVNLTVNTGAFAGGSNDGSEALTTTGVNLATSTPFFGGNDDGNSGVLATGINLQTSTIFSGGSNDGASDLLANALSMSATSSGFSGGNGKGDNGIVGLALNMNTINSVFNGGSGKGDNGITAAAQNMNASNSIFNGGSDDGATQLQANVNLNSLLFSGGADDGSSSTTQNLSLAIPNSAFSGGAGMGSVVSNSILILLPMDLLSFAGNWEQENAALQWDFIPAKGATQFNLERSFDMSTFKPVTTKIYPGSSFSTAKLRYMDSMPLKLCHTNECNTVYYRLRISENSRNEHFSEVIQLTDGIKNKTSDYLVFPNPAMDKVSILYPQNLNSESYQIQIVSTSGVLVYKSASTTPISQIDLKSISAGVYILNIITDETNKSIKIAINK